MFKRPNPKQENIPCEASGVNASSEIGITRGALI
ncbi:MAG: hypothetical protein XD36_2808 [Halomonas sp. 54_146]|nr:MAG: hypothetical protein XD36_2808 [Halomonas sp. 54_146]